jgi:nucleoside-triphosphatase THEP1
VIRTTNGIVSTEPEIQAAAVVYRHDEHDRKALADFARKLADSGCSLGGMVQEVFVDDQGRRTHIDSVDLATGDRVTINQSSSTRPDGTGCTLDTAALADAGAPLRRALINRPDLIIVEKFGEQEQGGAGLVDDILGVIADGLPVLVLVPEPAIACWRELTGGETAEVPCEADALRSWWRDRFAGK